MNLPQMGKPNTKHQMQSFSPGTTGQVDVGRGKMPISSIISIFSSEKIFALYFGGQREPGAIATITTTNHHCQPLGLCSNRKKNQKLIKFKIKQDHFPIKIPILNNEFAWQWSASKWPWFSS